MGGGGGGLGGQIPFSDSTAPRTLMSVLDAENSQGRGVLGFLTAQEQRKLRLNRELNAVIQEFPLGRDSEVQYVPDRRLVLRNDEDKMEVLVSWRRIHANAKNIKIQGDINNDQLIAFLTVPDNRGIVNTIDNLDLAGQDKLTDAIVPYLKGLKGLKINGCSNLGVTDAFDNLDVSRLETFLAKDTFVETSAIQRMVNLNKLACSGLRDPDFSMLTKLEIFHGQSVRVPKLPRSIAILVLEDVNTEEPVKKLQALLDSIPDCNSIMLKNIERFLEPVTASLKFNAAVEFLKLNQIQYGYIDDDSFQNCRLDHLSLRGRFRITPKAFQYMTSLRELELGTYPGDELAYDGNVFLSMPNLRILSVDQDVLRKLSPIQFASVVQLKFIS